MSDCKEMCPTNFGGNHSAVQCSRPAKRDGYCSQHHPDSVKKRQLKAHRKWLNQHRKEMQEQEERAIDFLRGRGYSVDYSLPVPKEIKE